MKKTMCVLMIFCTVIDFFSPEVAGQEPKESIFPKVDFRGIGVASSAAEASALLDSPPQNADFFDKYVRGKTVVISLFYADCDIVCDQVMDDLGRVQRSLGDRLGREVFIYSISLTPDSDEKLQAYKAKYKARYGWEFLKGSVEDVTLLRERLGVANLKSELARRLLATSSTGEPNEHTIRLNEKNEWESKSVRAFVGERVIWKSSEGSSGRLRITNWNDVKDYLVVEPVLGQEIFNAETGQNDGSTDATGNVLLKAKIKSEPAVPLKIKFESTQATDPKAGELSIGQQHSGKVVIYNDNINPKKLPSVVSSDPSEILDTIARLKQLAGGGSDTSPSQVTVEGMPNFTWKPNSLSLLVGDVIEWKMGPGNTAANPDDSITHGVRITNWAAIKDHVEVVEVTGQQSFNVMTGRNDTASGTDGQVLLRLKIKSLPPAPAEITYRCIIHGTMAGSVAIAAPTTVETTKTVEGMPNFTWKPNSLSLLVGDVIEWKMGPGNTAANPDDSITHGVRITNWAAIKDHVEVVEVTGQQSFNVMTGRNDTASGTDGQVLLRLKIKSLPPAPAEITYRCIIHGTMAGSVAIAAPTTVETTKTVEGMPNFTWKPNSLSLLVGNVIEWKMGPGNTAANPDDSITHGVRITNWAAIKDHVEVVEVTGHQPFNVMTGRNDTASGTDGQVLLRLKIKSLPPAPAEITYRCIIHGTMAGKLALDIPVSAQRRMLRFANTAYSVSDLMKSPQEVRIPNEHAPRSHQNTAPRLLSGIQQSTAEKMLANRPINGWSDLRECFKNYGTTQSELGSMRDLLDSVGPKVFGKWREVETISVNGTEEPVMNAALLHNGKVLLIPNNTNTVMWDPAAPAGTSIQIIPGSTTGLKANLFCSGHSFLRDGRLLVVGGGGGGPGQPSSVEGWKFDPKTVKWSRTANDMAFKRWYPTLVTLGHEPSRILIASGWQEVGDDPAPRMEIYSEATDTFELVTATGPAGDLSFRPTYPGLHLLPGGEIVHVPTGFERCDQSPSGAIADPTAIFTFSNSNTGSWRTLENNHRVKGMSVLLLNQSSPFVQAIVIGGGDQGASSTAQTMDLSSMSPRWGDRFPLLESRVHPNAVVLPDGTVFICGGKETGPNPPPNGGRCELYDPRTNLILEMDEMTRPRHYHSMAILLPSGEVMAAGGAQDGGCSVSVHNTIEVFKPPYLFKVPEDQRPVINAASKTVRHGQMINIETRDPSRIARIVLAKPMAVTHQTDSSQRVIPLTFRTTGPTMIEAQAPGGMPLNSIAPSGHYMLFILDQNGVPSEAKWIYLGTPIQSDRAVGLVPAKDSNDVVLYDSKGNMRSLNEYSGRAHMLVLIKGAFCKHCMTQLAEFQKRINPKKFPVVVITPENDLADLEGVPFTVLADPELVVFRKLKALGVEPLHGTFVFGENGQTVLKDIGEEPFTDYEKVEIAISTVLAQKQVFAKSNFAD